MRLALDNPTARNVHAAMDRHVSDLRHPGQPQLLDA
jgi:hypothetical protein